MRILLEGTEAEVFSVLPTPDLLSGDANKPFPFVVGGVEFEAVLVQKGFKRTVPDVPGMATAELRLRSKRMRS